MADDPKTGAATVADGTAVTPQAGTPTEPARDAGETAEQKATRLETELANERAKQAGWQAQVEEAKRIKASAAGQPLPTTAAADNPFDTLATEITQYREFLGQNPGDLAVRRLLSQAEQDYRRLEWGAIYQRESPKLAAAPEAYRAKADELFRTGRYATADDAILAARGAVLSDEEIAKAKQREADARAAEAAKDKPATNTTSATESPTTGRKMLGSEWLAFMKQHVDTDAALKLSNDTDKGLIRVDWDR
jgi:Arc/MetJ-type ribon-helix-helix transcriptional regulator